MTNAARVAPSYLCQTEPDLLTLETTVLAARPGAVRLARSPFFPGGGGQLADRGRLAFAQGEAAITGCQVDEAGLWHVIEGDLVPEGAVLVQVDVEFRRLMCELHTIAHVANALIYRDHAGALLTGAQLAADGTLRLDFDLPGVDPAGLRGLADPLNDLLRQDFPVRSFAMSWIEAEATPGMFRSKAVSPPADVAGQVRIVEIAGLDRQACGGTHLRSTGEARAVRLQKVENKGRHNRRLRLAVGA